ncbi:MAG: choloylglycine hydrolase [Clostridia bacterium]|nr:choloylglycine hydrolase [Clostridia bacterium]
MCTAITYKSACHYFGRNLDIELSYFENVVVTPRNFKFDFRKSESLKSHYAIIGMATVQNGYPLYYEATNEKGLSVAGLKFPENADYKPYTEGKENIAPFELIPYILGKCSDIAEAKELLLGINILDEDFSDELPLSPLHWLIADRNKAITVESVGEGLKIYDNAVGVLTNNPAFDYHMMNLNNYMFLCEGTAENKINPEIELKNYSLGMGALGLPGDFSSGSRFVKAVFVKTKSVSSETEKESVDQFFHILNSVAMPKGCILTKDGKYEYTLYSSCCNTDKGIYYYTTYDNSARASVDMFASDLEGEELYVYELK